MTDLKDPSFTAQVYAPSDYTNPGAQGEIALSTTPNSVKFQKVSASNNSNTHVQFNIPVSRRNCLGRNIHMKFPCKFKCVLPTPIPAAGTGGAPDDDDLEEYILDNYFGDVVMAPTGILSICKNIRLSFGTNTIEVREPSAQLMVLLAASNKYMNSKVLSNCLLKQDDIFDYGLADSATNITVVESESEKRILRRTDISSNIFTGALEDEFGSRMPAYKISLDNNSRTHFFLHMDLESFIPSTLFNIDDETKANFYGLENFSVELTLLTSYGALLSQKPQKNGTAQKVFYIDSLDFPTKPELRCSVITPPTYLAEKMLDPSTNAIRDYVVGFNHYEILADQLIEGAHVAGGSKVSNFSYVSMGASCLPKRLFIAVIPDHTQDVTVDSAGVTGYSTTYNTQLKNTFRPRVFARIDRLDLQIGAHSSLVGSDKEFLYQMSVANGLHKNYEEAMYLSGFPVICDLRRDTSLGGAVIGATEHTNIGVQLDFTNLCNESKLGYKFRLFVIGEFDAVLTQSNGNFSMNYTNIASVLTQTATNDIKTLASSYVQRKGIYLGGGIWSSIKRGLGWVVDRAPDIYKGIKTGVDMYKTIRGGETRVIGGKSVIHFHSKGQFIR